MSNIYKRARDYSAGQPSQYPNHHSLSCWLLSKRQHQTPKRQQKTERQKTKNKTTSAELKTNRHLPHMRFVLDSKPPFVRLSSQAPPETPLYIFSFSFSSHIFSFPINKKDKQKHSLNHRLSWGYMKSGFDLLNCAGDEIVNGFDRLHCELGSWKTVHQNLEPDWEEASTATFTIACFSFHGRRSIAIVWPWWAVGKNGESRR